MGSSGLWRAFAAAMALLLGAGIAHGAQAPPGPAAASIAAGADGFVLADGRAVRLAGIRVPHEVAGQARALLEELVLGAHVRLAPAKVAHDRYGRLVAQVERADGLWLQGVLLERGLAQVATRPGEAERAAAMAARERTARAARRGLWARPALAPITADEAERHIGSFRIVRGRVLRVAPTRYHVYLNFGADWRTDFTLRFSNEELEERFVRFDFKVEALAGRLIEVRGFLLEAGGPLIDVSHPEQIEVLE